jgi:tRNA nucleotidyltransferase (CCA-adding enzyme)
MAARLAPGDELIGFCAMTRDLGTALAPASEWPKHIMHEERGVAPLRALAARLRVPTEHAELGVLCCRLHLLSHRAFELRAETLFGLIEKLDAFRKPQRLGQFITVCEADKRGRLGMTESDYPQAQLLRAAYHAAIDIKAATFVADGLQGPAIAEAMRKARVRAVAVIKDAFPQPSQSG